MRTPLFWGLIQISINAVMIQRILAERQRVYKQAKELQQKKRENERLLALPRLCIVQHEGARTFGPRHRHDPVQQSYDRRARAFRRTTPDRAGLYIAATRPGSIRIDAAPFSASSYPWRDRSP